MQLLLALSRVHTSCPAFPKAGSEKSIQQDELTTVKRLRALNSLDSLVSLHSYNKYPLKYWGKRDVGMSLWPLVTCRFHEPQRQSLTVSASFPLMFH